MFSVSAVASADACMLKAVFKASPQEGALMQGPRAFLGSIAHELIESAILGIGSTGEATFKELERVLDSLLKDARERLSGNPVTAPYSDLTRTMSPLAWARMRRTILDIAYESAGRTRSVRGGLDPTSQGGFRFENLSRDGQWIEVPIEVPELRLKGRMDVFDRRGKEAKITDIKSGRVEDDNGEIAERILRQIRLYGLMVNWIEPSMHINLMILAGVELTVSFNADARDETLVWLRSRTDLLPPDSTVSCDSIAKVGPDCRWCDMRHKCVCYLKEAPPLWDSNLCWPLPVDVWGTIERIDSIGADLVDLTLLDAGGRQVKVFRLHDSNVAGMSAGDRIWFFNLSASITDLRGKSRQHPPQFLRNG